MNEEIPVETGEVDSGADGTGEQALPETEKLLGPPERLPMFRQAVVSSVGVRLPETFGRLNFIELDAPKRALGIPISIEQAGIIAGLMDGLKPPRPMMGDLFCEVMTAFDFSVAVVQITCQENSVYLAQITFTSASDRPRMFPCRPSDGVILALGQPLPVPILIDEDLFN